MTSPTVNRLPSTPSELQLYLVLHRANLLSYYETFITQGGDDVQQLVEAGEDEFLEIMALVGMATKPLHVRRLQKSLQEFAANPTSFHLPPAVNKSPFGIGGGYPSPAHSFLGHAAAAAFSATANLSPSPISAAGSSHPPLSQTLPPTTPQQVVSPAASMIGSVPSQGGTNHSAGGQSTTGAVGNESPTLSIHSDNWSAGAHEQLMENTFEGSTPVLTDEMVNRIADASAALGNGLQEYAIKMVQNKKKISQEMLAIINMPRDAPGRLETYRRYAAIYGRFDAKRNPDKPLTLHEVSVNEAAAQICLYRPALLSRRDELFPLARQAVRDSGYQYARNSSRLKYGDTEEIGGVPKRAHHHSSHYPRINGDGIAFGNSAFCAGGADSQSPSTHSSDEAMSPLLELDDKNGRCLNEVVSRLRQHRSDEEAAAKLNRTADDLSATSPDNGTNSENHHNQREGRSSDSPEIEIENNSSVISSSPTSPSAFDAVTRRGSTISDATVAAGDGTNSAFGGAAIKNESSTTLPPLGQQASAGRSQQHNFGVVLSTASAPSAAVIDNNVSFRAAMNHHHQLQHHANHISPHHPQKRSLFASDSLLSHSAQSGFVDYATAMVASNMSTSAAGMAAANHLTNHVTNSLLHQQIATMAYLSSSHHKRAKFEHGEIPIGPIIPNSLFLANHERGGGHLTGGVSASFLAAAGMSPGRHGNGVTMATTMETVDEMLKAAIACSSAAPLNFALNRPNSKSLQDS